jgi:hypothetical protein
VVKAAGIWVLTEPVVVGDKTINALVDFGQFAYEKSFTVGPEVPVPPFPPPVPPTPPGQRWAIVWEESSERTPQQAALYVALRKQFKTDRLLILDVSTLPPAWEVYRKLVPSSQVLPALQVLAADKQVRVVSLPASVSEVVSEVKK